MKHEIPIAEYFIIPHFISAPANSLHTRHSITGNNIAIAAVCWIRNPDSGARIILTLHATGITIIPER